MMKCPKCHRLMVRDERDRDQYKCAECGFQGICRRCEQNPVHPHRKWHLCLDCICDLLDEAEVIDMKAKWIAKVNDIRSRK